MKKNLFAAIIAASLVLQLFPLGGISLAGKDCADPKCPPAAAKASAPQSKVEVAAAEAEKEEPSDLDLPVATLWGKKCEHNISQYQCDECRYEVGVVRVPASLLKENGKGGLVGIVTADGRSFSDARSFSGEVALSDGKTVHAGSPLPGTLLAVLVDVGTRVEAGDPLFEIDSHEVAEAKGELLKKEAARNLAKKNAEREAYLFKRKISAEMEVQEAEARLADAEIDLANAKSRLLRLGVPGSEVAALDLKSPGATTGKLVVRAAQSGTVLERHASVGERVEAGKELLLLSDLSEVWVWATLREGDLPALARKDGAAISFPAEVTAPGGAVLRGTMDMVHGVMNEQTRTLKARIVVANRDGLLRPGMFVSVRVRLSGGGKALAIPRTSILTDAGRSFVFVHKEGEFWIRRPVRPGRKNGDMVEIRSGVSPGQRIIADGAFLLKSDVLRKKMGAGCAD